MREERTIAGFHCFAGSAGDMALGARFDAGADFSSVLELIRRVPLGGWDLELEETLRGGIACSRAVVTTHDDMVVRTHANIVELVTDAKLPDRVAARSLGTFQRLAEVEGRLHRRSPGQVHFHEVGGHDAIVDVVGTAAALEVLGVDDVYASAIATGTGMVRTAHGLLPNPSPAVVRLLEDVPTYGRDTTVELTTPTGAALLATMAVSFGPLPPMAVRSSGFGAGSHELDDLPNCTQVVVGQASTGALGSGQPVVTLEATVDDVTGEQLGMALANLLASGAYDAWVTPVLMKKGRPGHILSVLCEPALADDLRGVLQRSTGSFGVRESRGERWPARRTMSSVEVDGHAIRMKVGPGRAKAEFDDVAMAAKATGLSLHEVASRAEEAWRAGPGVGAGMPLSDGDPA